MASPFTRLDIAEDDRPPAALILYTLGFASLGSFLLLSLDVFLGRVHGGAQIVPEKNRESFPLSKDVVWCCLRMLLLAEYWGVLQEQLQTTIQG